MGELAGQPNYFLDKIWITIINAEKSECNVSSKLASYMQDHHNIFGKLLDDLRNSGGNWHTGKLHTIRAGNRWKAGMLIHPVINNRTKNRFQFAPTMMCSSVQEITIRHEIGFPHLWIGNSLLYYKTGGKIYGADQMKALAINDGFNSVEDFFAYFNTDFKGQIIHRTDLKY